MRINSKSLEDPTNSKARTLESVQARIKPPGPLDYRQVAAA